MDILGMGEIVGRLAETRRVYALEFQGRGRTTGIDRPITYPHVAAFMEAVGIEKADVFGYSMGTATGLSRAIDLPGMSSAGHQRVVPARSVLKQSEEAPPLEYGG
jgi:pimeloyl-ACP methyl ester carboxylesterase